MFSGTVESKSHEGGLLVHFDGSSPSLNAIVVRSDDGHYIGKVDGVLGNTNHPLAHVAHVDRSLDMDALIGVCVTVRAKQPPKEPRSERSDGRRYDERRQDRRGDRRSQDRRPQQNRHGRRDGASTQQRQRFGDRRQERRQSNHQRQHRQSNPRQPGVTFNDNDWTCSSCKNVNFSFRNECNRCGVPRSGGGGGRRQDDGRGRERNNYRSERNNRAPQRGGGRYDRGPQRNRSTDDRGTRRGGEGRDRTRSYNSGQQRNNRRANSGEFRRAKGKRSGHAHNKPPRDFRAPRKFERSDD